MSPLMIAAIPVTVAVYLLCQRLYRRFPSPLLNPVVVTMALLIAAFLAFRLNYPEYSAGSKPLTMLLDPAVVALAIPLYRQLEAIRRRFAAIMLSCLAGVACSLVVGTVLAAIVGGSRAMEASLAPKAVTTPIAMTLAEALGGIPSVTAMSVIFAGIIGAAFGFAWMAKLGITDAETIGLAIGSASHALGTARCVETDHATGAFSSLSLVICAVLTSIVAPIVVPVLLALLGG